MSIHEGSEEDLKLYGYVRIAVAMAIIKRKPCAVSAKEYTLQLSGSLHDRDHYWKRKVAQLDQELLKLQQELLSVHQSRPNVKRGDEPGTSYKPISHLSDDKDKTEPQLESLERYMAFRKVMLQCKTSENSIWTFKEDSKLYRNSFIAALEWFIKESHSEEAPSRLQREMCHTCGNYIKELLEMPFVVTHLSEIKPKLKQFADSLIEGILQRRKSNHYLKSSYLHQVLLSLGTSSVFRDECLAVILWHISQFAVNLRNVAQGEDDLNVLQYQNIYQILMVFERILTQRHRSNSLSAKVQSLISLRLSDSLLHISLAFPLFTHYLWRLQASVDCVPPPLNSGTAVKNVL